MKKTYEIDRKAASRLLKVSMRTVDRYVKSKKLSTRLINGRIRLDKEEVKSFTRVDNVDMSTSEVSIDNRVDKVDKKVDTSQEIVDSVSTIRRKINPDKNIYKKLHEELSEELKEKQERLEIANYRVGQLETQLRNSIPMLEYHKESFERKKKEQEINENLSKANSLIQKLNSKLKLEKFNKRLFIIILLIVLALQPLWFIFMNK